MAKVDFGWVPFQGAAALVNLVRGHLPRHEFADIGACVLGLEEPARTPMDAEIVEVVAEAARRVYRREPLVYPSMPGTGPMHVPAASRGIPAVGQCVGHIRSNVHAPDENLRLSDYPDRVKHIAVIRHLFAGGR